MVKIDKVYTKGGDSGETSLIGGDRVSKDDLRIACYGTVDELNAFIGVARGLVDQEAELESLATVLKRIQSELFNLGCQLAAQPEFKKKMPEIRMDHLSTLEADIDRMNEGLPELTSFVLPGGGQASAALHVCRTVCRRAERLVVGLSKTEDLPANALQYLNRLSDAFFVFGRYASTVMKQPEDIWDTKAT